MTANVFRLVASTVLAVLLTGCGAGPVETSPRPPDSPPGPPVPVLDIGDPFVVDLFGNGQATVTLVAAEVSTASSDPTGTPPKEAAALPAEDSARLVATIEMVLDRAGDPVVAGPNNFLFRDTDANFHRARTDAVSHPPELRTAVLATTGQRGSGKVVFDVDPRTIDGGQIQLMAGRLVLAIWRVHRSTDD
jgi:hypothetical protein